MAHVVFPFPVSPANQSSCHVASCCALGGGLGVRDVFLKFTSVLDPHSGPYIYTPQRTRTLLVPLMGA